MKNYSVKEVSEILGTSQETVRRWIRDGKLGAERSNSRKEGSTVSEGDLQKFLASTPKYASIAAASLARTSPAVGISLALFGISGAVASAAAEAIMRNKEIDNSTISTDDLIAHLNNEIRERQSAIDEKLKSMAALEAEAQSLESQIKAIEVTIDQLASQ